MSLWKTQPDIDQLNARQKGTIGEVLDIRFEGFTDDSLSASMVVDQRTTSRSACCTAAPRW